MASVSSQDQVSITCPVCLDLLKDPVTIPCGHNFCMQCIKEDWKGEYICPLCRHTFSSRAVLYKNRLMADMVEKFVKNSIQTPASDRCYARRGDVACDVCTGRKLRAVKSCLDCLMSYCDTHLKAHNELVGRNHTMVDAVQLKERVCPRHKKAFEVFCRTDQSCICLLCTMDDHKGHDTITAAAEWSHKKEGLGQSQRRCQQMIQLKEKEMQKLKKAVKNLKSGAQTAVKKNEKMFTEMIHCLERRCSEVTELIRAQEKAEESRAEGLLKLLEQEIAELKRKDAEMEQLSLTQDPIHFLKNMQDMVPISGDLRSDTVARRTLNQSRFFVPLKKSVSALQMQLEEKLDLIFKEEIVKIYAAVSGQTSQAVGGEMGLSACVRGSTDPGLPVRGTHTMDPLPPQLSDGQALIAEPVTREDFLKYSCHFTLDPNTAHPHLYLSEGNTRVEYRQKIQSYPDHPDRFDTWSQVLCREGVSARCYWEVEWSGKVAIAVSYKSICREGAGDECWFGHNYQSWSLEPDTSSYRSGYFWHNNKGTKLPLVASSRIGVYVDHRAGTLAFYSITGDTMTLLHRVHTTFTHTLYPGFGFMCFLSASETATVKLL
ncbi:tripartite motif-containing protein 16-like [Engraulis encrasicolus]|uniref:tripartite motif-containing protein 16-like n=1 Tax=Engraulis encrasicolus TaxID=184585 RepID=UPI002FD447E2